MQEVVHSFIDGLSVSAVEDAPVSAKKRLRVREYWAQTDIKEYNDSWMQTDDALWKTAVRPKRRTNKHLHKEKTAKLADPIQKSVSLTNPRSKVFADVHEM